MADEQDAELTLWLDAQRLRSGLRIRRIPLNICEHWSLEAAGLKHATGRFFSIVGCYCEDGPAHLKGLSLPMIDQPEIGILGFVARLGATGWEWLLQAKTEPGNVGGTQIGPTVQATRSNYMCAHGGKPTQMLELFVGNEVVVRRIADVEQSEQGDRFLGKYNRNMVVQVDEAYPSPDPEVWRWFSAREVRAALHLDFKVNTDARSVLFCSDWALLTDSGDGQAFSRWQGCGGFGERLLASLASDCESGEAALSRLAEIRNSTPLRLQMVQLESLAGWRMDDWGMVANDLQAAPVVEAYAVASNDREVPAWCQPLMKNTAEGRVVLVCAEREGVLKFMLDPSVEPGFREVAQFAPSLVTGLGHALLSGLLSAIDDRDSVLHASVLQSDEGGRFMHSIARYEIVEISEYWANEYAKHGVWVTLAALRQMADCRGFMTNELRSVLSLLLKWA